MMHKVTAVSAALSLVSLLACGDDPLYSTDPFQDYEDGNVTVLNGDDTVPIATGQLDGETCLQLTEETCVPVTRDGRYCKTDQGPVDVVVVDGQVKEVVCYRDSDTTDTTVVVTNTEGGVDLPQTANGAVLTFGPATNGVPIEGDVTVDGNNVTVYGNGPENTIINGDLVISGNNARIRGVRVTGNVSITLNTAAILFSVIEGNLILDMNNSLAAENQVYGNIEVRKNNSTLVRNGVRGNLDIQGSGTICDGNYAITDPNNNKTLDEGETGAALSCS
jgi:hypothetical protein